MYKLIDFILLIILIGGMIHNYSSLFAGYRRKKELPYIVIVYLIEAPYRGFMAKNMPYTDLAIDAILFLCFLVLCIKEKVVLCYNYLIWLIGFLISALLYVSSTVGILGILRVQEAKFYIGIALLLTMICTKLKSKKGVLQIANVYIVNSIIISIVDLISFMIYKNCAFCETISNRNFISIYNFLGLVGLIYISKTDKRLRIKLAIVLIMVDLLLMKSSSVYLAIFILVVILWLQKMHLTSSSIYGAMVLVCIVAVVGTIATVSSPQAVHNDMVVTVQKARSSDDYTRTLIWEEALKLAKENILYGIGPDKFRDTRTGYKFPTHNDYLKVLVETGVIGLLAFITFVVNSCWQMIRIKDKNVRQGCGCAILALLIFVLFHGYINYVTFWIVMSIPYWWIHIIEQREKIK